MPTYPAIFAGDSDRASRCRKPTIFNFDDDYQNPRVQQASAGVEWQVLPRHHR